MSTTWAWYADAGLTVPLTRGDFVRGSTAAPVDRLVYFGSTATGKKLQCASAPGVDPLQVTVADSAVASGVEAGDVVLALTAGALASNTPGAALGIGTTLLSGAVNAVPVYVRIDSALTAMADYDDASIEVGDYVESAV